MRFLLPLLTAAAALVLTVSAAGAPAPPRAHALVASGALAVTNSHAGAAVLGATGLRPGATTSGTVQIGNGGEQPGRFTLAGAVADTPGAGGGRLSERLRLVVQDVTSPVRRVTVYTGTPAGLDSVALGTLAAGERRDYRLTATFVPGGAGDKRLPGRRPAPRPRVDRRRVRGGRGRRPDRRGRRRRERARRRRCSPRRRRRLARAQVARGGARPPARSPLPAQAAPQLPPQDPPPPPRPQREAPGRPARREAPDQSAARARACG